MKQSKPKSCKCCGKDFYPYRSTEKVCSLECAVKLGKDKVWKAEKQKMIDKARTRTEWLNLAQVVFNTYIRLRDKDKGCITCGKPFRDKYDAGHFFSASPFTLRSPNSMTSVINPFIL